MQVTILSTVPTTRRPGRLVSSLLGAVLLVLGGLAAPAWAQGPPVTMPGTEPTFADLVPASTIHAFQIPDAPGAVDAVKATNLAQILNSEELAEFLSPIRSWIADSWEGLNQGARQLVGISINQALVNFEGEIGIAVTAMGENGPNVLVGIESPESVEGLLQALVGMLAGEEGPGTTSERIGGVDFTVLPIPGAMTVRFGWVNGWLLIGSGDVLSFAVAGLDEEEQTEARASLAMTEHYQAVRRQLASDGVELAHAYGNVEAMLDVAEIFAGAAFRQVRAELGAFGLDQVVAFGGSVSVGTDGHVDSTSVFHTEGRPTGLLGALIDQPALTYSGVGMFPADSFWFAASSFDFSGTLERGLAWADEHRPDDAAGIRGALEEAEEETPVREYLAALGSEFSVAAWPLEGDRAGAFGMIVPVHDEELVTSLLDTLGAGVVGRADGMLSQVEVAGLVVWRISEEALAGADQVVHGFTADVLLGGDLYLGVAGGYLVVTNDVAQFGRVLAESVESSLSSNASLREAITGPVRSKFEWVDGGSLIGRIWDYDEDILRGHASELSAATGLRYVDWDKRPEAAAIARFFPAAMVLSVVVNDEGIILRTGGVGSFLSSLLFTDPANLFDDLGDLIPGLGGRDGGSTSPPRRPTTEPSSGDAAPGPSRR